MTRARRVYGEESSRPVQVAGAVDVTEPKAGFYRFRLRSGAVWGAVRIWHGPPLDPVTGEELDRSWRWQAEFNGEPIAFDTVWPVCAGDPVDEAHYRRCAARQDWARTHAPESAYADPARKRDPLAVQPLRF